MEFCRCERYKDYTINLTDALAKETTSNILPAWLTQNQ